MKVLMVGVDKNTKGGMWSVIQNYFDNKKFIRENNVSYIASATSGNAVKRLVFSVFAIIKIFFYTLFHDYKIVHVHMSERASVYRKGIIIKISKIRRAKIVIHMHGAEFETWYKSLPDKKQRKVRKILNSADKIIILGEYWKKFISSLIEQDNKISIIYNGVKIPAKNLYNKNAEKLLFFGEVGKRKGIFILLDAIKQIEKHSGKKIELDIYGSDKTSGIETIISSYNLESQISYKGFLNKNKEKAFKNTAINILPSYNEGLPMTILETMSCGIPNISTNIAAIPEAISDKNGILVKPGNVKELADAISALLFDKTDRLKKSKNAYETVKRLFSVEAHCKAVSNIYAELAQ